MKIVVTASPIVQVATKTTKKKLSKVSDIVALAKDDFAKAVERVKSLESKGDKYAMPFVEVYNPKYNDELSGEVTVALESEFNVYPKPICKTAAPTVPVTKEAPKAKAKAAPKKKASGAVPLSQRVRDLITANPEVELEGLIDMCIKDLDMPKGKAKTYVTGNLPKVRG